MKLLKRLFHEEDGVTLIEYGLIAALIAIAVIVTLNAVGVELDRLFGLVEDELKDAGT